MLNLEQVDELEKLIGQLDGLHLELTGLAKKSPNDAVNTFKLHFVNSSLTRCNILLGEEYKPFNDFDQFNIDDVPSNSDVTFMLSQYMESLEKYRSDSIHVVHGEWCYNLDDSKEKIQASPPDKLKRK
jgi:hypothetical protein